MPKAKKTKGVARSAVAGKFVTARTAGEKSKGKFVLGRAAYKQVAAVEGLVTTRDLERDFREFDNEQKPASARRAALTRKYAKKRA
jgi:hypothetical protein